MAECRFPILHGSGQTVPWSVAEVAYCEYVRRFGDSQTLERIAERGGFSRGELDMFYPDWRKAAAPQPEQPDSGESSDG